MKEEIIRIILVEVLGLKQPERVGKHCRDRAEKAADLIMQKAPTLLGEDRK